MKILNILFTLFGVITVIFFLFQVLPGDPGRMMMGQNEDDEQLKAINARYGFDKPVIHQYFFYLNDISPISIHSNNNTDFNYSTNPTYVSSSKIVVKNNTFDNPVSYITTVGLYSADNELLAVAKLSEPIKKDPTNELTFRVRLDY